MSELDQLTASTRRLVREDPSLIDMVFQADPVLAYLRQNLREDYDGGYRIDEPFVFDGMNGGAFAKGAEFDITEKQVEQNLQFTIKEYYADVTLALEDVRLINTGRQRIFSLVKSRMSNAYMTLGAHIALSLYMNGQRAGFTNMVNGLAELINDNSVVSWDNNTYSLYGTITRGGQVGTALNSSVVNVNGAITYNRLSTSYAAASYGSVTPNLGVTTPTGLVYIKNHFQPQQRFETVDPNIGFRGVQFEGATIIVSRYCPGTYLEGSNGTADSVAVTFMTKSSGGVLTRYPATAVASSETLFWVNARKPYLNFYVSRDALFGFGFTGFKWAQGNLKVAGQVVGGIQMTGAPRYHSQIHGFTS